MPELDGHVENDPAQDWAAGSAEIRPSAHPVNRIVADYPPAAWGLLAVGGLVCGILWQAGYTDLAITAAATVVCAAILLSPFVGLCLTVFSIPTVALTSLHPQFFTLTKALAVVVLISFTPRMLLQDLRANFASSSLRWFILIPIWAILTLPFAVSIGTGVPVLLTQYLIIGLAVLVAAIPRDMKQLRQLCLVAVISGATVGLAASIYGVSGIGLDRIRDERLSLAGNANETGKILGLFLIASAIYWVGASRWKRVLIVICDIGIVAAIGMTNSRGTWVALACAVVIGPILSRRARLRHRMFFFSVASIMALVGFYLVLTGQLGESADLVQARLRGMVSRSDETMSGRTVIWHDYLEQFRERPVPLGMGIGYNFYIDISPHNDALTALIEQGPVGLMLLLGFWWTMYKEAGRNVNSWLRVVGVSLVVFVFFAGMSGTDIQCKWYGVAVGLIACQANLGLCPRKRAQVGEASAAHVY